MKSDATQCPFVILFVMWGLCFVAGCYSNRVHGVLPRTGELFMSTRAPMSENNGGPILFTGVYYAPTIIAPIVCAPAALGVGILDQCVCSPIWDVLCIPADLTMPTAKMRIVNTAGVLVTNSYVYCAGKHEANKDGVIQFKLMRTLGNPASVTVEASGYVPYTYSVPRDGKEHSYVLLNREEFWKKQREDDARRIEEMREAARWEHVKQYPHSNPFLYWKLVLSGPLERLKNADLHYDNVKSGEFKHVTFFIVRLRNLISTDNLNYLFSLMELRPELAHEWSCLYGAPAIQEKQLVANRVLALKLAEDKNTKRPLFVVLSRLDTPDEYLHAVMENPKLAYCRNDIENLIRKRGMRNEQQSRQKLRSVEPTP